MKNKTFKFTFELADEVAEDVYKTTICKIYVVFPDGGTRFLSEGISHWNPVDTYDPVVGKYHALLYAVDGLPKGYADEFDRFIGLN